MKRRNFWYFGLVVMLSGLLLAGCSDEVTPLAVVVPTATAVPTQTTIPTATTITTQTSVPTATPVPVSNLKVTAVDQLNIPANGSAYLSPDGKLIAWTGSGQLCIFTAAGQKQFCNPLKDGIYEDYLRWSPDSQKLVFTEDFLRFFHDPDIWVMNASDGKLLDLTDDHMEGQLKLEEIGKSSDIDLSPRWSGDSRRLIFMRYIIDTAADRIHPVIYTISAEGGTPAKVGNINADPYLSYLLAWSPDGKQIAFNKDQEGTTEVPNTGISLIDSNGQNTRQVLKVPISPNTSPSHVNYNDIEFSPDGRYLLGYQPLDVYPGLNESTNRIFSLSAGVESAVDSVNPAHSAGWSPTGSALLYLVPATSSSNGSGFLYIVDKPGGQGKQIYDQPVTVFNPKRRGLDWASNNTVLVWQNGKVLLLHLGSN